MWADGAPFSGVLFVAIFANEQSTLAKKTGSQENVGWSVSSVNSLHTSGFLCRVHFLGHNKYTWLHVYTRKSSGIKERERESCWRKYIWVKSCFPERLRYLYLCCCGNRLWKIWFPWNGVHRSFLVTVKNTATLISHLSWHHFQRSCPITLLAPPCPSPASR